MSAGLGVTDATALTPERHISKTDDLHGYPKYKHIQVYTSHLVPFVEVVATVIHDMS